MTIKKIKISNFKSFKNLEIELGKFNVLIGANASGKSNFIQIFKFLRDVRNHGLDNAISMQGGVEYLRNINIGSSENFSVEVVVSDLKDVKPIAEGKGEELLWMRTYEMILRFVIGFRERGLGFEIIEDKLTWKGDIVRDFVREKEKLGPGEITISNDKGKIDVESFKLPEGLQIEKDDIFSSFLRQWGLEPESLLLESHHPLFPLFFHIPSIFSDISIYDFDPKLSKKAIPITGKAEMEEDGSNLAIVLKNIIENKEKQRKFSNLVKDILPFVDNLDVEKFADKSLLFKLKETYTKKQYLPSFLISDGTINITALIIGLYFEKKPLTIIEESEKSIHPYLISKVTEMMKDASKNKQIIVTTHNPEMVKYAGLENILLISRDKDGFSVISKPHEKETVKTFLQNELGIEELYVQNLLELET